MYNHNKAQQSKNRVHISWDILYLDKWQQINLFVDTCKYTLNPYVLGRNHILRQYIAIFHRLIAIAWGNYALL